MIFIDIVKVNIALMLFKNGKFSIEQASHFANLSLYDFMEECKKNQIPVIRYEKNELENEMKLLSKINNFSEFRGIWKDRDISQEAIRKQAWKR